MDGDPGNQTGGPADAGDSQKQDAEQSVPTPANPKPHLWKPGTSGNPGGRPKGPSIKASFMRFLRNEKLKAPDGEYVTYLEAYVKSCVTRAIAGNAAYARIVADIINPAKGARVVIQKNEVQVTFELDEPPLDNPQHVVFEEMKQRFSGGGNGNGRHLLAPPQLPGTAETS